MNLDSIKQQMLDYVDFFGGEFLDKGDIRQAESIEELNQIFQKHHEYLYDQCGDAQASLERFRRKLELDKKDYC